MRSIFVLYWTILTVLLIHVYTKVVAPKKVRDARLRDGASFLNGTVEVKYNQTWWTLCNFTKTNREYFHKFICRQHYYKLYSNYNGTYKKYDLDGGKADKFCNIRGGPNNWTCQETDNCSSGLKNVQCPGAKVTSFRIKSNSSSGVLPENTVVNLTCAVNGGIPEPILYWNTRPGSNILQNGSTWTRTRNKKKVQIKTYIVVNMTSEDHCAEYLCHLRHNASPDDSKRIIFPMKREGSQCTCHKKRSKTGSIANMTKEKLEQAKEETRKQLTVKKQNLKSYTNKKISAGDQRSSSKAIGIIGIFMIILPVLIIVAIDVMNFVYPGGKLRKKSKRPKKDKRKKHDIRIERETASPRGPIDKAGVVHSRKAVCSGSLPISARSSIEEAVDSR